MVFFLVGEGMELVLIRGSVLRGCLETLTSLGFHIVEWPSPSPFPMKSHSHSSFIFTHDTISH